MDTKTLIYARRSTESGDDFSLDTQIAACRTYAAAHGLTVVGEIRENYTGTKHLRQREQGSDVWAQIASRQIDAVIVYCIDRLSRAKLRHALTLIDEILEQGVQLHSADVGPIADTDDIGLIIRSWQASEERKKIVERMARGRIGKAQSGRWPGDMIVCYGYDKRGERRSAELVINEYEAGIVREIYDLYLVERLALAEIANRLNRRGVRPPTERAKGWYPMTLRRILRNPIYVGFITTRGVTIPLPHLRLIGDDQFALASQTLERNQDLARRNVKHEYLLRGRLKCECGRPMYGHQRTVRGSIVTTYDCAGLSLPASIRPCSNMVGRVRVDDAIERHIVASVQPDRLAAGLAALAAADEVELATAPERVKQIDAEAARHRRKIDLLLTTFGDDDAAIEEVRGQVNGLRGELTKLTTERQALLDGQQTMSLRQQVRMDLAETAAQLRDTLDDPDAQLLREVADILNVRAQLVIDGERRGLRVWSDISPEETVWI